MKDVMGQSRDLTAFRTAGVFLGLGLGALFYGVVFHQILQWHHLITNASFFDPTTLPLLENATYAVGGFDLVAALATFIGIGFLWHALQTQQVGSLRALAGPIIMCWGLFNLADGVISHFILGIHHINQTAPRDQWLWWDIGFLVLSLVIIVIGWQLSRERDTMQHH
jgi:uncharacterized membrane protein